jgi:hypothetical protein
LKLPGNLVALSVTARSPRVVLVIHEYAVGIPRLRVGKLFKVYGPTALCGALLIAVIVNFSLRFKQLD